MKKRIDIYKMLFISNLFLLPILASFLISVLYNYEKYDSLFKALLIVLIFICISLIIVSLYKLNKQRRVFTKVHLFKKVGVLLMFSLLLLRQV